ncbi:MAG: PKD domain-containing protein [Ferruginibacter sp.]
MKNIALQRIATKFILLLTLGVFGFSAQNNLFGQLAVYPLRSANAVNNNTPNGEAQVSLTNANVEALKMIYGTNMEQANHNGTGVRMRTNVSGSTAPWPTTPTDGYGFDIPISPKGAFDMSITGITVSTGSGNSDFDVDAAGTVFYIAPYFQVDNAGPWYPLAAVQTVTSINQAINFGTINETFYSTHKYTIRFYVYSSNGSSDSKSDYFRLINLVFAGTTYQPPAKPVNVSTLTAAATGKYTGTVTGKYDFNNTEFYLVKQSGVIWATSQAAAAAADTSVKTKTKDGSAGVINSSITGLTAGTDYWAKAYIITQFGIQYGAALPFKTNAATAPVITTTDPASDILSNKATGGGTITDSGGVAITSKGLVWNLSGGATLSSNTGKVVLNGGSAAFSELMKGLNPGTKYCYRAYATNSLGTSYGSDVCFTTAAAAPVLVAIPGTLDFGENFASGNAITVSYSLSGSALTAGGTITISVPAASGFQISLTGQNNDFKNSLTLTYTGTALPKTPIFVRLPTGTNGSFTGVITHSGGGVSAANADVVNLKGSIVPSPDDVTNRGTDFWLGFGYQESMKRKTSDAAVTKMSVYISAGDQPATVVVEIPGVPSFIPQTLTIPANSVRTVTNFPSGDDVSPNININSANDARLFFTGITNRGIHVYSTNGALVSVWQHIYANNNSAGGSMIFPTNTWNSSYTVQSYAGVTNNTYPCNSFFYAIANEDGTEIEFTPSNDILSNASGNLFTVNNAAAANILYKKGQTYKVTINRGQVFTALGAINGDPSNGGASLDLSGTTVRATTCEKKIAVFCGNGRVITKVNSCNPGDGSDNLIQQMFPTVAWGTRYLTVPTKGMEYNLFRIYVKDPATVVKVNGAAPGALINNLYYETEGNAPKLITSDKPINVTQFILAGSCKGANVGNSANGDPEMIILSPIEQAVTKTVVYSAKLQKNGATPDNGTNVSYINVILKKEGLTSFKIDGIDYNSTTKVDTGTSSMTNPFNASLCLLKDAFKPHPQDANYLYAKLRVKSDAVHVLSSASPFNSIAYGMGDGESYGYNAGTSIKNLSSYKISVNPEGTDSSSTVVRTCKELPITLKIAFPYNPSLVDSVMWEPNDARVTPNARMKGAIDAGKAKYDGTVELEGRTYYIYTSPTTYRFSENALYRVKATAYGTFASDCPGEDQQIMLVNVGQDNLNLRADPKCNNPTVSFTADTIPMVGTNILSWKWEFGEGQPVTTGTLTPQSHTYPSTGGTVYTVKLTTKNTVGCYSTDSVQIDFGGGLTSAFNISDDAVCANDNVTFTDASYGVGTSGSPNKWDWDFGDGKTSTAQNPPAQSWSAPGIKTIALTVSTPIGCVKTFKDTVTVEATPVAAIDPNPAFVCLGDDVTYKDASTIAVGTVASWDWKFDDGTTSTAQNPVHKWLTAGKHTATLTVKSAGDCPSTNTDTHEIDVNATPVAGFSFVPDCTTRTVAFTDTSNGFGTNITAWDWDFGDGSTHGNKKTESHTYATTGSFTVTLTVTTANGCKSLIPAVTIVNIDVSPVADFTLPGNTCLPNASAKFTNTTTITDGTIGTVTYAWTFGDNGTSTDKDPTHVYTATGNYSVKLTATSAKGCVHDVTKQYSAIFADPVAVIANINEVCAGSSVTISSAGSTAAGSTITGWTWDFGDNSPVNTTDQNPTHTYATAGSYPVKLTVTSAAGCTSSVEATKNAVVNALPTADFTADVNCTTRNVEFKDASTPNSGTVNSWTWNYGDNSAAGSGATVTHQYAAEGTFTVTLSVKTDKGCTSSVAASKPVTIAAAPVVDFDLPGNLCLPNANGTFTNKTTISDGTLAQVTYAWEFGDGNTSTLTSPSNPFTTTGPFQVKLTATSNQGCKSDKTKTFSTVYAQPTAVITAPAGVCLGNNTQFNSSQSTAPASSVTGWAWAFGDGGTSTDPNPVYVYQAAGNKTVTLTVTSAAGCSSAPVQQSFDVNLSPVPSFTFSAIRCEDSVITFTDASTSNATGGITEWKWKFDDAGTSTDQNPTHVFNTAKSYNVSLELKNANGCLSAAAYTAAVVINPNPVSNFETADICIPNGTAQFTQKATISSGSVTSWAWDFGDTNDPTPGSGPTPPHTYTTGGEYQVKLTATSDQGCAAVYTGSVKAYNVPTPLFNVTGVTALCSNLPVSFTDQSVVNGYGSISKVEIYWDYLNNPTAKEVINAPSANASYPHQYPEFGTPATKSYRILIRAFSGNGCTADYSQDVDLLASPSVQFAQPAAVCQEAQAFNLTGASDIYNLPGAGAYTGTGITTSPEFSPEAAGFGSHTIRYTYTTTTGCTDFEEKQLVVNPTPVIDFGGTEINVLEGDVMKLEPEIQYGATYLWNPATYLNNPRVANPSGLPTADITYTLGVTSDKGCFADKSVFIRVVKKYIVPNTFTPNHDNIHDRWEIENLQYYPSVRVRVYNRSGQLVFESLGYNTPWDGTYKGKDMPFGTYYYVIETGGGRKPKTGYVTILK